MKTLHQVKAVLGLSIIPAVVVTAAMLSVVWESDCQDFFRDTGSKFGCGHEVRGDFYGLNVIRMAR